MRRLILSLIVGLSLLVPAASASADGPCQFQLGFATVAGLIPQAVGQCTENEGHNPLNGDGLQHSTGGLLVWRKADNWTAFTDGYHSWINGPNGLQQRLNTERFNWEGNTDGLPVVGGSVAPIVLPPAQAIPAPKPIGTKLTASIGTTVDFQANFSHVPFHGVVNDAYATNLIPAVYYSDGSIKDKAIPAPGNSVFAIFVVSVTNTGTVSDTPFHTAMAVRDVQGRTFTYEQTPNDALFSVQDLFGTKSVGSGLGPSLTDKFTYVYVVAPDASGVRLIPAI